VLSIGLFFSLMVVGLSSTLPESMSDGLVANGVPAATAQKIADEPPVGSLFAAFLGYNPMEKLVPADTLASVTPEQRATITGKEFFPHLISQPFHHGLVIVFGAAAIMMVVAAAASLTRGTRYIHDDSADRDTAEAEATVKVTGPVHTAVRAEKSENTKTTETRKKNTDKQKQK